MFSFYTKSHCSKQFLTPNVPGIPLTKHERCQSPQLNVEIKMASLLAEKKKESRDKQWEGSQKYEY